MQSCVGRSLYTMYRIETISDYPSLPVSWRFSFLSQSILSLHRVPFGRSTLSSWSYGGRSVCITIILKRHSFTLPPKRNTRHRVMKGGNIQIGASSGNIHFVISRPRIFPWNVLRAISKGAESQEVSKLLRNQVLSPLTSFPQFHRECHLRKRQNHSENSGERGHKRKLRQRDDYGGQKFCRFGTLPKGKY